jgi:hypothetical protein
MTLIFRLRDAANKLRNRNVAAAHRPAFFRKKLRLARSPRRSLRAPGVDIDELESVREQHTRPLPGFDD